MEEQSMTTESDKNSWRLISGRALLLLLLLPASCAPKTTTDGGVAPQVVTKSGAVVGTTDAKTGTHAFRGIPYAQPPVGDLRFKAPVPAAPWEGVLDATEFGSACAQVYYEELASPEEFGPTDDEDCLTLNIWTPGLDDERRPVMVWIHGGANWTDSSRTAYYHGQKLSERGDVVVASLNYRLGIFGFVDMSVLGGDAYDGGENNGIRDQILALRWIRQNIDRFGGDPRNVTAFGESAGSNDIGVILATENPGRLFDRAILQSGAGSTRPSDRATEVAQRMLQGGGVQSIDALLKMSGAEVLEVMQKGIAAIGLDGLKTDTLFRPTLDGELVKGRPGEMLAAGNASGIDLMIGTTAHELRYYYTYEPSLMELKLEDPRLEIFLEGISVADKKALVDLYARNRPDFAEFEIANDILSDRSMWMPSIRQAEAQLEVSDDVWMYLFEWEVPDSSPVQKALGVKLGAAHGVEVAFVFSSFDDTFFREYFGGWPKDATEARRWETLVGAVQDSWTAFARSGDPSAHDNPALPHWPRYDSETRATMAFDYENRVLSDPKQEERLLWARIAQRREPAE
jgi:para-nitrobenzyl esterase